MLTYPSEQVSFYQPRPVPWPAWCWSLHDSGRNSVPSGTPLRAVGLAPLWKGFAHEPSWPSAVYPSAVGPGIRPPPKDAARIPVEAKLAWPDAEPSSTFALYFLVSRTGEIHLVIYYKLPSLGHFVIVVHTDWYHRTSFCIFALIYTHIWCFNTFTQNSKRLHSTTVPINRTKQCHIYLVKYWTTGNYCMRHPGGGL